MGEANNPAPSRLRWSHATPTAATTAGGGHGPVDDDNSAVFRAANLLSVLVDQLARGRVPHLEPQAVVDLAVRTVSGAFCADIVAWRDDKLISVAASAGYPRELDAVRVATGEGPCYDALKRPSRWSATRWLTTSATQRSARRPATTGASGASPAGGFTYRARSWAR